MWGLLGYIGIQGENIPTELIKTCKIPTDMLPKRCESEMICRMWNEPPLLYVKLASRHEEWRGLVVLRKCVGLQEGVVVLKEVGRF